MPLKNHRKSFKKNVAVKRKKVRKMKNITANDNSHTKSTTHRKKEKWTIKSKRIFLPRRRCCCCWFLCISSIYTFLFCYLLSFVFAYWLTYEWICSTSQFIHMSFQLLFDFFFQMRFSKASNKNASNRITIKIILNRFIFVGSLSLGKSHFLYFMPKR